MDKQVTIVLKEYDLVVPTVEANTSMSQLQQKVEMMGQLQSEVERVNAECNQWKEKMDRLATGKEAALTKLAAAETQLRSVKERCSAQAEKIAELKAKLAKTEVEVAEARAEVKKTQITADKTVVVHLRDTEAAQTELREAVDREKRSIDLARCQSRRETLEEIHARGFDLNEEIAQAKADEADARFLISSDDDDDSEGNQGGSDNEEGPEAEPTLDEEAATREKPFPKENLLPRC